MAQLIEGIVDGVFDRLNGVESWLANDLLGGWTPSQIPDLTGKVFLVTGGNSGIGYELCRKLCENQAHVYMVSRDMTNGQQAAMKIRQEVGKSARLEVLECDMSSLSNVVSLAREFKRHSSKLDCLVNNAGIFHPGPFALTGDNLEQTLHVNYYAHLLLTLLLLDTLRESPGSRVLFQSSPAEQFGKLQWDNLTGEKYKDSGMTPYGTSKLYMMMASKELSVRVPEVDFICTHPGLVNTPLQVKTSWRYWTAAVIATAARIIGQTPYHGAWSTIFSATNPDFTGQHWKYIGPNNANMWHTTEREPANKPINNPISCWQLLESSTRILQDRLKTERLSLPPHPKSASIATDVYPIPTSVGKVM